MNKDAVHVQITIDLENVIKRRILKLELNSNRQAVEEGQLIAYKEVLRLAHGGISE